MFAVWSLGFRVWGLGSGVWGVGFTWRATDRVLPIVYSQSHLEASGFRDYGFWSSVQGLGVRVWGLGSRV